ncbi:MAG: hypothetical protein HY978_02160, partial [Candidatus Liptonbacteria bacterium]|nr:hypothetical protein [Candidatus Liptonbacteria bacterium]
GRVGLGRVEELTRNILNGDLPAALGHLAKIQEEGASAVQLTRDLIHYFRKVIALAADPKLAAVIQAELTAEELARAAELAKKVSPERHAKFVRSLIRAYAEMRYSPFALIPLELALVEHLQASS